MKNKTSDEFWIPDAETYSQLQKLRRFVDFVAGLEFASNADKENAVEINSLIQNINKPNTYKGWCVCLDIYDRDIQFGTNISKGFYNRSWSVFFEAGSIEIEAFSRHTEEALGHYGKDFHYYGVIIFTKKIYDKRFYMDTDLDEFVADAFNYKNYITENLNDIEIEIDVW